MAEPCNIAHGLSCNLFAEWAASTDTSVTALVLVRGLGSPSTQPLNAQLRQFEDMRNVGIA